MSITDLAMVRPRAHEVASALKKAAGAYGDAARTDALKAIDRLVDAPERVDRCIAALGVDASRAAVIDRLMRLRSHLG